MIPVVGIWITTWLINDLAFFRQDEVDTFLVLIIVVLYEGFRETVSIELDKRGRNALFLAINLGS